MIAPDRDDGSSSSGIGSPKLAADDTDRRRDCDVTPWLRLTLPPPPLDSTGDVDDDWSPHSAPESDASIGVRARVPARSVADAGAAAPWRWRRAWCGLRRAVSIGCDGPHVGRVELNCTSCAFTAAVALS